MKSMRHPWHALAALLALGTSACVPIPIRHMEQVTPRVIGTLRREDGAPAAGFSVALTGSRGDATCAETGGRGITDSAGRFIVPAVSVQRRVLWFTMMESFGMTQYWLCAGGPTTTSDSVGQSAQRTLISGRVRGDTLDCLAWTWRKAPRATCNGWSNQQRIFTAGAWSDNGLVGTYRVLVPDAAEGEYGGRVVVQWLTTASPGTRAVVTVRAQEELTTGNVWFPDQSPFELHGDTVRVRVRTLQPTRWGNQRWLTFELGPPAKVRLLTEEKPG